jgi:tetratricopeptide (TPR) repeat protein
VVRRFFEVMKVGSLIAGFLLLLVFSMTAMGQQAQVSVKTPDEARARLDELRVAGFEALYSLDYEGARQKFKEIARLFPEHPAGPQFLAAVLWTQTLNESRRLQSSLYASESFYGKTEDAVNPRTVEQFRELTRSATLLAKARLKTNPRDVEALYFLGATEGLKAAFAAAVQRSFMSALRDGSSSVDRHRDVIKLDPGYRDAELTIGLYDYVVGTLPLPIKLLASIGGVRGSKKRGLLTLERVAKEGRFARDDARSLLIVLYKREKRYADALALARELGAKYPRNYLYKLEQADALMSQAAVERQSAHSTAAASAEREALATFEALLQDRMTREAAARSFDLIHFRYGDALFTAGRFEQAAREFLAATTALGAEPGLAAIARLRAAQSLDLAGKRNEALVQYRAVLQGPDVEHAHEEAKRGLREPYKIKNEKSTPE